MVDVGVVFPEGRGVARWAERHADSPVPSRWPYGLDGLAAPGLTLTDREVRPASRVATQAYARGLALPASGGPKLDVAIAWEESLAVAMRSQVRARRRVCGVIWATDAVAAGAVTPALRAARTALRNMDALWTLARPQVEEVESWLGKGHPPVHHLPFGVDTEFYAPSAYPERPLIASIGGDRDRDPETLYAALELVLRARPDVRVVVGSRSPLPVPSGVERHEFIPHDEVRRLFARASVVAIATRPNSHVSGMTVALEAGACARPVVTCATPGMDDYVLPGETGELVPAEYPEAMAAAMLGLLEDQDRAARMGLAAREHVVAHHSTHVMCEALRTIALG
ncbi:glycosyltransferase family 4 protein [Promicromonospora sp. NPDC060271]|uniref:glycosyltransferase family 4 protein n=1 Tax=Promicromonospora sp. NPDC060271 TaxID=3347089 RepID=UPI003661325A